MNTTSPRLPLVRVYSLNLWGVPVLARHRRERVQALCAVLALGDCDIVLLQEVWVREDRQLLAKAAFDGQMRYSHYFSAGIGGSGLMVLSRYPIVEHAFYRYTLNGKPYKVHQADWFGAKGVGLARIQLPSGGGRAAHSCVDVFNTHFIARYAHPDEYRTHRALQAFECARFVSYSQRNPLAIVAVGNLDAFGLEYRVLCDLGGCADLWLRFHACSVPTAGLAGVSAAVGAGAGGGAAPGLAVPAAGATYTNSYCARDDLWFGQRIDFIFVRERDASAAVLGGATPPSLPMSPVSSLSAAAASPLAAMDRVQPLALSLALSDVPQVGPAAVRGIPHYSDHTGLLLQLGVPPSGAASTGVGWMPSGAVASASAAAAAAPVVTSAAAAAAAAAAAVPATAAVPAPPPLAVPQAAGSVPGPAALGPTLRDLSVCLTQGQADVQQRTRWHTVQMLCGVVAWLSLLVLGFAIGRSGSLGSAFLFVVLAPSALLYSAAHATLSLAFTRPEGRCLREFESLVVVMQTHGCAWSSR